MKKTISLVIVLTLVLVCVANVASAASNPFGSKVIYCQSGAERFLNNESRPTDGLAVKGRFYVRHYLWGDWGGVYTNYFKASNVFGGGTLYGGNWMAPDTANYVRSNSLAVGKATYAWGRANTDYGVSYIEISGYSDPKG